MTEDAIQHQIKLVTFKATSLHIDSKPATGQKASFDLKLDDLLFESNPNWFAKVFRVTLNVLSASQIITWKVEYHTVFECSKVVDDTFLETEFAKISAPAIGFPYVRAFISTISLQAGHHPVLLPSINFVQFSKNLERAKAKEIPPTEGKPRRHRNPS